MGSLLTSVLTALLIQVSEWSHGMLVLGSQYSPAVLVQVSEWYVSAQ